MNRFLITLLASLSLAACSHVQRVDSTVQSHAQWSPAAVSAPAAVPVGPQRYRFERLPSQQEGANATGQDRLEAAAVQVLQAHGWNLAEAGATGVWTVQISASAVHVGPDPWDDGWHFHGQIVAGNGYLFWSPMFMRPIGPPATRRDISLIIRDPVHARVVYETRATHESRWNSTPELWQAMLEAAMRDFPNPPAGTRQVDIDIRR